MTQTLVNPFAPAAARRATRRRWAARGAAGLLLCTAVAYVALPWWLPTTRIRLQLEQDLSRQVGWPVRIGGLRAGWLGGIVLSNLTIRPPGDERAKPLLRVGSIGCDLAPLRLLAGRKLRELQIIEPELWLEIGADGQLDLPSPAAKDGGQLPSLNYSVRGILCHVSSREVHQTFRIDQLDLQLDPGSGLLHLASATRVVRPSADPDEPKEGRLEFDANVRVPRLKPSEQLNGDIRIEWSNLAVNDLPVPLLWHVTVEQVDGTSNGRLSLKTQPDLRVDYALSIALNGVQIVRPDLNQPAQVPDAELAAQGHWDPTEGVLVMHDLHYETRGIKLHTAGPGAPAVRFDEDGAKPLEVHLHGWIKDFDALRRELPEFDRGLRDAHAALRGSARFNVDVARTGRLDHLVISSDASAADCTVQVEDRVWLAAPAKLNKQLRLECTRDRQSGMIDVSACAVTMGSLSFEATGEMQWLSTPAGSPGGAAQLVQAVSSLRLDAKGACGEAADLRQWFPALAAVSELKEFSGPVRATLRIDPEGSAVHVRCSADLPVGATLSVERFVQKPSGVPLSVRAEFRLPFEAQGRFEPGSMLLQYGDALIGIESRQGGAEYQIEFDRRPDGTPDRVARAEADSSFELRIQQVEGIVGLSPWLGEQLMHSGVNTLVGDFEADGHTWLSYRPGDTLVRSDLRVLTRDLGVGVADLLDKPRGERLNIDLLHSLRAVGARADSSMEVTVSRPSGRIRVAGAFSLPDSAAMSVGASQWIADVEMDDPADWLGLVPRAERVLAEMQLSGPVRVDIEHLAIDGWQSGSLSADATRASVTPRRGEGFAKLRSVPATLELNWSKEISTLWDVPTSSLAPGPERVWKLHDGRAELAGTTIGKLEGEIALPPDAPGALPAGDWINWPWITLSIEGVTVASESLRSLHPVVADFVDRMHLTGRAGWQVGVQVNSGSVGIGGRIEADEVACRVESGEPLLGLIEKQSNLAAYAAWQVELDDWQPDGPRRMEVDSVKVGLGENTVELAGTVEFEPGFDAKGIRVGRLSLTGTADLSKTEQFLELLPGCGMEVLGGGISGWVTLTRDGGPVEIGIHPELQDFHFGEAAHPIRLNGRLDLQDHTLRTDRLGWSWGRSSGLFSGTVGFEGEHCDVQLGVAGGQLYVDELVDYAGGLKARITAAQSPAAGPSAAEHDRGGRGV